MVEKIDPYPPQGVAQGKRGRPGEAGQAAPPVALNRSITSTGNIRLPVEKGSE